MNADSVQIQVCDSTLAADYSFICPVCKLIVNKSANERVIEALGRVGVRTVHWTLPAELSEAKFGPPITHDDLLAFHLALGENNWQDELAGHGSS